MNAKTITKSALLIFAFGSLAFLAIKESRQWSATSRAAGQGAAAVAATPPAGNRAPGAAPSRVVAYYFHTTYRCATCRRIEAYSREAIETGFAAELKSGKLEWRLVNLELPENEHFSQQYKLVTKSLVLVRITGGKEAEWANLKLIWDHVGEKAVFVTYVQTEVRKFLEKP
jgi:hypothetical protein